MLHLIAISGPFGILAFSAGTFGLLLAVAEIATAGRSVHRRGLGIAALVALLFGIAGTAFGLTATAQAASMGAQTLGEAQLMQLWRKGVGVAMSPMMVGALAAVVDLLALGALGLLERRWTRRG